MNLIAAVDENWAIGYKGELLAHISGDMKFFRSKTSGKVVVLGRKTLSTFPGGRPLKERTNIVLTADMQFDGQGAEVVHSLEELFKRLTAYKTEDVYVIGGESVYSQLIDYCDTAYITRFHKEFKADAYIGDLEKSDQWRLADKSELYEEKGIEYYFCTYRKK